MREGLNRVFNIVHAKQEYLKNSNGEAVNMLLLPDIMESLGYDTRLSDDVEPILDSERFNWLVKLPNLNIAFSAIGFTYDDTFVKNLLEYIENEVNSFKIRLGIKIGLVVITNGTTIWVSKVEDSGKLDMIYRDINLFSDDSHDLKVLNSLARDSAETIFGKPKIDIPSSVERILKSVFTARFIMNELGISGAELENDIVAEIAKLYDKNDSISATNTEVVDAEIQSYRIELGDLKEKLDNYRTMIEAKNSEITRLSDEVDSLNKKLSIASSTEHVTDDNKVSHDYIKQIQQQANKIAELEDTISQLNNELDSYRDKLNRKENSAIYEARQLLDTVVDNTTSQREYAGVLDSILFQTPSLNAFVGRCLQTLYDKYTIKVSSVIFDMGYYRVIDGGPRRDMIINNKPYDLDFTGLTEEEVLKRLVTIFNDFKDTVFVYKVVGQYSGPDKLDNKLENDEYNASIEILNKTSESTIDYFGALSIYEIEYLKNNEKYNYLNTTPYYFQFDGLVYRLNYSDTNKALYDLIYCLMNYSNQPDTNSVKQIISQFDFTKYSFCRNIDEEKPLSDVIMIPYTNFYLDVHEFSEATELIAELRDTLGIRGNNDCWLYLRVVAPDNLEDCDGVKGPWVGTDQFIIGDDYDSELLKLDSIEPEQVMKNQVSLMVSLDIAQLMYNNPAQYKIQSMLIGSTSAVKYQIGDEISNEILYKLENVASVFGNILDAGGFNIQQSVENCGNVIGESIPLLSIAPDDCHSESLKVVIGSGYCYMANLEPWQVLYHLIDIYIHCTNQMKMIVKIGLNTERWNKCIENPEWIFTGKADLDFETASLIEYLSNRLAKQQK